MITSGSDQTRPDQTRPGQDRIPSRTTSNNTVFSVQASNVQDDTVTVPPSGPRSLRHAPPRPEERRWEAIIGKVVW